MYFYSAISMFAHGTLQQGLWSDYIKQFTIFFEGDLADAPNFRI